MHPEFLQRRGIVGPCECQGRAGVSSLGSAPQNHSRRGNIATRDQIVSAFQQCSVLFGIELMSRLTLEVKLQDVRLICYLRVRGLCFRPFEAQHPVIFDGCLSGGTQFDSNVHDADIVRWRPDHDVSEIPREEPPFVIA